MSMRICDIEAYVLCAKNHSIICAKMAPHYPKISNRENSVVSKCSKDCLQIAGFGPGTVTELPLPILAMANRPSAGSLSQRFSL